MADETSHDNEVSLSQLRVRVPGAGHVGARSHAVAHPDRIGRHLHRRNKLTTGTKNTCSTYLNNSCFFQSNTIYFLGALHKGLLHGMMNIEHMRKQKKQSQACKTQSCSINAIRSFLQYHNHGWFSRSVVFHTNYRQAGNLGSFLQYFSPMMSTTRADQPVKGLHVMVSEDHQKLTI